MEAPSLDELITPEKKQRIEGVSHPLRDRPRPPSDWTVDELADYLHTVGLKSSVVSLFKGELELQWNSCHKNCLFRTFNLWKTLPQSD